MRRPLLFATILSFAAGAGATEWLPLGPRPMAMGGAGVASPQGAESAYWNPASLALAENPSGLQVPAGGHLGVSGSVLSGAKDLNQVGQDCQAGSAGCTNANIQNALNELSVPGNGVRGDLGAGAGLKLGRSSLFANSLTYAGAKPVIDTVHNTQATIKNNTSALQLRGVTITELGWAYGHDLPFAPGLSVGGAAKALIGRVGFQSLGIVGTDPANGALDQFRKSSVSSFQPGLDLGALWDVDQTFATGLRPRVGLTAHDVNNPRFKNTDAAIAAGAASKYSVQGGLRLGVALTPLSFWNVVADADLTRNLTALEGVKSQQLGVGTEVNVFNRSWLNIPLRAGLSKNLAESGSKAMLTGGFGLNFLHFNVDLAAQVTPASQTVQTQGQTKRLPTEAAFSGQVALLFGGGADAAAETFAKKDKAAKKK